MSQAGNYADCEICEYKLGCVEESSNNTQQLKAAISLVRKEFNINSGYNLVNASFGDILLEMEKRAAVE